MARTKISEFSSNPATNTDIDSIFIGEGMAPSNVNDAIRELMAQLKDWQSGTSNDPYVVGSSGSLTLNQGTANTVPYLNGSKVVTSGTALSFDGSNLGLGVTPSAWGSNVKAFQVTGSALSRDNSADAKMVLSNNAYRENGSVWKYIGSAAAAMYQQGYSTGDHQWYTAPSGTAGNAITFTQAMTLNASGQLIVGSTSSPSSSTVKLAINGSSGADAYYQFTNGSGGGGSIGSNGGAGINFYTITGAVGSESATLRATIDSSGNLLVGTTSADPIAALVNGVQLGVTSSRIASASIGLSVARRASDGATVAFLRDATTVGTITVTTSTTAYNTSSDYRLKNSIAPMTGALAKVAQLKPVTYKWNADGSDGQGFIAHELAEVCPDAVTGEKDAVDAEGNPQYQGIDVSFLVATLTAAIQELKAEFDAYKATHP